jgi:uncharacterized damage-inducible protein DinB
MKKINAMNDERITMNDERVKSYIEQIQQLYYGPCWIDESFEDKLRPVNEENAFAQPHGYIHSIAEIVSHIVEWRKDLLYRIETGKPQQLTMDSEKNWVPLQVLKANGWAPLKETLVETQQRIVELLEKKHDAFLDYIWADECRYEWLLAGWIQHDAYHLGQIGLVWKMIQHPAT